MDMTALQNRQNREVFVLIAMYDDRQYFIIKMPPKTSYSISTRLIANAQIYFSDDEGEILDMEERLDSNFIRVKPRVL